MICRGEWHENLGNVERYPILAIIVILAAIGHIVLSIPIFIKKKDFQDSAPVVPFKELE